MRNYPILIGLFLLSICNQIFCQKELSVINLKCEYESNPIGIETLKPRFSWQIVSDLRKQTQSAFQILVANNLDDLTSDNGNIWDTKKTNSGQLMQIEYHGKTLIANQKYYWKVKVWNQKGSASDWSAIATWQMGLLSKSDWGEAHWITMPELDLTDYKNLGIKEIQNKTENILPLFRKDFKVGKPVKNATAYISGLGQFEISLNGDKVGDHFLDPGWTTYEKYSLYATFDITGQLRQGKNTIGVMLGNGFYNIPKGGRYRKADLVLMHGLPKMICKIIIEYQDGTKETLDSNSSWKVARSPVTFTSIYGGEDYDARLEQDGWNKPGFNDNAWQNSVVLKESDTIHSQRFAPLKVMETFKPNHIFKSEKGKWVYDLGQNFSGIVKFTVQGKKGDSVSVFPGELLDSDSSITQRAVGSPYYFAYKCKGNGTETCQPRFAYTGFRYVQIENAVPDGQPNLLGLPVIKELTGLHTRSSAEQIGNFSCSDDLFNKTNKLIDWGIKSNMASVLTDCPHREKLGWLEQTYLMGSSMHYSYDVSRMFTKTIEDMQSIQLPCGLIPAIAPEYCIFNDKNGKPTDFRDTPEWGSAYIILPWYMYQWYGDKRILESHYEGMQKYMEYLNTKSTNRIISQGLGDWYDLGPNRPGFSQLTTMGVTATATWYYDAVILSKIANLLGKKTDIAKYNKLASEIKAAFNETFFKKDSCIYDRNSQTANAMAIYLNLADPEIKDKVLQNLMKEIRNKNNVLTAGDIGFRYLIRVLEDNNASDVIFDMNSRTDVPGYGYQLAKGATALTESWQALPVVSNNHLMLGHLMEWFYSGLAGIRQEENSVAYKNIVIKPEIVGDITKARANYQSMYGVIESEWQKKEDGFYLTVQIPVNTTATIYLPAAEQSMVTESSKPLSNEIQFIKKENGRMVYEIGSGRYFFKVSR